MRPCAPKVFVPPHQKTPRVGTRGISYLKITLFKAIKRAFWVPVKGARKNRPEILTYLRCFLISAPNLVSPWV